MGTHQRGNDKYLLEHLKRYLRPDVDSGSDEDRGVVDQICLMGVYIVFHNGFARCDLYISGCLSDVTCTVAGFFTCDLYSSGYR